MNTARTMTNVIITLAFVASPLVSTAKIISQKETIYRASSGRGQAVEEFNSAEGLWAARNDLEGVSASVSNGQLHISYEGNGRYFIANSSDMSLDYSVRSSRNFELTTTASRPLDPENWDNYNLSEGFHSYGMYWGYRDDKNYKMLLINLSSFSVGKIEDGVWTGTDWKYGEEVLTREELDALGYKFNLLDPRTIIKIGEPNKIRVRQKDGLLKVFVNGPELFSSANDEYIGELGRFGVLMQQSGSMTIDRFAMESWGEPADMAKAEAAFQAGNADLALLHVRPLAEEGNDALAQARLGQMYLEGIGVTRDFEQGISWLEKSAAQGDDSGQVTLGMALAMGPPEVQDMPAARSWLLKGMQGVTGQPSLHQRNAAYILGTMFGGGTGGPQDFKEAKRWLELAAEPPEPHPTALSALGEFSLNGWGGNQDVEKARQLFLRAVKLGEPAAAINLCMIYGNGMGVTPDLIEAYKWCWIGFQSTSAGPAKDYAMNLMTQLEAAISPAQKQEAENTAVAWMREQL